MKWYLAWVKNGNLIVMPQTINDLRPILPGKRPVWRFKATDLQKAREIAKQLSGWGNQPR